MLSAFWMDVDGLNYNYWRRAWRLTGNICAACKSQKSFSLQIFSFSGPTISKVDGIKEIDQRTLERKILNLEMSTPTSFHMPPLHTLLAPDVCYARNAASILILPATLHALCIEHWPRDHDAREMLQMVAQDSRPDSLLAVKMIWVHREMMTTSAELTHSPNDTICLSGRK